MSINASIEFLDFFSQSSYLSKIEMENTEEIHINIKYEDNLFQDKYPNSDGIFIQLVYFNEDIKLPIIILKDNNQIGKGNIILNQKQITSRETLITKWVNLDQIDSKKGKSLNSIMKINVKISLTYNNFNEVISNNHNHKNAQSNSKVFPNNKNNSGVLNQGLLGTTLRSNNNSRARNDFFINSKIGLTPKSKGNQPFGKILHLNDNYKSCVNKARNVLIKVNGKTQVKPLNYTSKNFGNHSLNIGLNYNISYSESTGLLGSASSNNLGNDRRQSNLTKNSTPLLLKNCSSSGNPKTNSISISRINRNSDPNINPKNLNLNNSQTPNLQLKIDDDIDDHESKDTSVKDSIYNDDNNEILDNPLVNFKKNCQNFIDTYTEKFLLNIPDEKFLLKNEATLLLEEMFKIQENYYSAYTDTLKNNIKLKELLVEYNTKYRLQIKKNHNLSQIQESLNIKNILSTTVNREEKSRLKDISQTIKNEIGIMKKLKKNDYNSEEKAEFMELNSVIKAKEEKKVLIKAMLNIYRDKDLNYKIPIEKQSLINNILKENGLIFEYPRITNFLDNDFKLKPETRSNCIEIDFTDTFKDKGSNNNDEDINKGCSNINESINSEKSVEPQIEEDEFDKKLNILLKNFNKKVTLKKISNGVYEYYGNQLRICLENEEFKVKIGSSGLVDLLKFLDLTYKKNGFSNKNNGVSYKPAISKSYNSIGQIDTKLKNYTRSTTPIKK